MPEQQQPPQSAWQDIVLFVGLDWASDHHDIVAVDAHGRPVVELTFDDTADGWALAREKLLARTAEPARIAVAIETSQGPAVERLLALGVRVYPMNPKAASRFRDRKAPSGGRNDRLDAFSFADGLRTDGHGWRALTPDDPLTQELRMLCRDEIGRIAQRTSLVNQLRQALHEYYPAALEAFDDWTCPASWAFIEQFPTPAELLAAGKRRWEKFLHVHRLYRPETSARRLEVFAHAGRLAASEAICRAKSRLALSLAGELRAVQQSLDGYRQAIDALFARHPDHDLFDSLPGIGPKLAPRLLSELGDDLDRFEDAEALGCYAGTAPVTIQSGKSRFVRVRRACNKWLRAAMHLWTNLSRTDCVWASAYYDRKRAAGKGHASALRCLGQRWLKILQRMRRNHCCYDEALHLRNMTKRGSWTLALAEET